MEQVKYYYKVLRRKLMHEPIMPKARWDSQISEKRFTLQIPFYPTHYLEIIRYLSRICFVRVFKTQTLNGEAIKTELYLIGKGKHIELFERELSKIIEIIEDDVTLHKNWVCKKGIGDTHLKTVLSEFRSHACGCIVFALKAQLKMPQACPNVELERKLDEYSKKYINSPTKKLIRAREQ